MFRQAQQDFTICGRNIKNKDRVTVILNGNWKGVLFLLQFKIWAGFRLHALVLLEFDASGLPLGLHARLALPGWYKVPFLGYVLGIWLRQTGTVNSLWTRKIHHI